MHIDEAAGGKRVSDPAGSEGDGTGGPKKALKVDLVNAWELVGGAAQAANRLYKALRTIGVEASMLVYERSTDDPLVRSVDESKASPELKERIRAQVGDDLAHTGTIYHNAGVFGLDHSERGVALLECLDPEADIINLHWVGNLIDWELFFTPGRVKVPVVWTMHDMRPFTGGCHYSGDCVGYRSGCGNCKFFGGDRLEDLSRIAAAREKAALAGWQGRLHVVTPSHWLAREALTSTVMEGVSISVIPNSIDLELFQRRDKVDVRTRAGLPVTARILLFVAHVLADPRKGSEYLIAALPAIQDIPDLLVLTIGSHPPAFPETIRHINAGNITDQTVLNCLYAAADLVVLPTLQDNLPNIILEAFASGTPVAGFAVGGVPDHVIEGETGFLAPPRDSVALASALRAGLTNMPRLARMGQTCRAHAEREFAQSVQAGRYRELFERLTADAAPALDTQPAAPDPAVLGVTYRGGFADVVNHLSQTLPSYPRRVPGKLEVDGNIISYADLHSFYFQSLQIFRDKAYNFESSVPNPLIIDCGAHIGMASMFFAAYVPGATIHAYEADPEIAAHLQRNLASLKIANVVPHAQAVWIHDRGVEFVTSHDDSGFVSEGGSDVVTLPSVRLRDLLQGRAVELLKIDVEGAEYDLLSDCDGMLGSVNKIVVETHHLQNGPCRLGEMLAVLERNGFRYVPFDLHAATWAVAGVKPPFTACPTDKYIISFFAWKDAGRQAP